MTRYQRSRSTPLTLAWAVLLLVPAMAVAGQTPAGAGQAANARPADETAEEAAEAEASVTPPPGYVIGPGDVLGVVFWRDAEMSGDVTVRPDGVVTIPLIRDVHAQGRTPDELRAEIETAAGEYIQDPTVTVVVRQINSRVVYINGEVTSPGAYPLTGPMTVVQLIAVAGGLSEWANDRNIRIMRADGEVLTFSYRDVARGRDLEQNVRLEPGDTVIVP